MDRAEKITKRVDDYLSSLSEEERKDFLKSMGFKLKEDTTFPPVPTTAPVKKKLKDFIYVIGFLNIDGDNFNLHEKWFNKNLLRSFEFIDMYDIQYASLDFGDGLTWISPDVELFKTLT